MISKRYNSERNVSGYTWFVGEIFNNWQKHVFGKTVDKTLEYCWNWSLTILPLTNTTSAICSFGTLSLLLSLVIILPVPPSNFIVSGVKSSRYHLGLILNVIIFWIFLTDILTGGLPVFHDTLCTQNIAGYLTKNNIHQVF